MYTWPVPQKFLKVHWEWMKARDRRSQIFELIRVEYEKADWLKIGEEDCILASIEVTAYYNNILLFIADMETKRGFHYD